MSCDPERVTGYVDGVLDAAASTVVEAHMASCPACREQADFEKTLRRRLRHLEVVEAPQGLDAEVRRRLQGRPRRRHWHWALPMAASLVLLILWGRGHAGFVAWQLARDHDHCFGKAKLPAKVWSGDRAVVTRWFEQEGTSLPVVPESAHGLELVGGRHCPLIDRFVAHLYYAGHENHLSLYVVPGSVRFEGVRIGTARDHTVSLLRVGRKTVGLVGDDAASVDAFRRALATTVAWGILPAAEGR